MPTVPADTSPLGLAALLDSAADQINAYGLQVGDWWQLRNDTSGDLDYSDGCSVCPAGAIAVSLGYRKPKQVEQLVCGIDMSAGPHPAWSALMRHLNCSTSEQVMDWADTTSRVEVIRRMRLCATDLRRLADLPAAVAA